MNHSTGAPNKAQQDRWRQMQEIGCLACLHEGHPGSPGDIHHLVEGGRRLGHDFTIVLCPWHHRGVPPGCASQAGARALMGPSLDGEKREFVQRYGAERDLVVMANALITAKRG